MDGEFFDFLPATRGYSEIDTLRMNRRHQMLIDPFRDELRGARVLDVAAHDGRWSYAMAAAGAEKVVGVEARPELVSSFADFPASDYKHRVELRANDLFDELRAEVDKGETYDVVALFGIYYHIMHHYYLLELVRQLRPRLILIDSEFVEAKAPMIQMIRERTDNILNAAPQVEGQEMAVIGVPSFPAMERMAEAQHYRLEWSDVRQFFGEDSRGLFDYYGKSHNRRRALCALRPMGQG